MLLLCVAIARACGGADTHVTCACQITLMKGIGGTEARLIKAVMPLACVWLVATMVVSLLFLVPPGGFID